MERGDDVRGGFPRRYRVWVLDGLDASWTPDHTVRALGLLSATVLLMVEVDDGPAYDLLVHGPVYGDPPRFVLATPDPYAFCLVFATAALVFDVRDPANPRPPEFGSEDARAILSDVARGQLVYVHDHGLDAYAPDGLRWQARIMGCGIHRARLDGDLVRGEVDSFDGLRRTPFAVDAATGTFVGPEPEV